MTSINITENPSQIPKLHTKNILNLHFGSARIVGKISSEGLCRTDWNKKKKKNKR